jgi:GxxExxY protein
METIKYEDLTRKISGCAMKVHSTLGNGFQEVIYQRCLAIDLEKTRRSFQREIEMPILCDDHEDSFRSAAVVVADKVLVELKAILAIEDVHLAPALSFPVAYSLDIGLLISFGARSLQFKRLLSRSQKSRQSVNPVNPDSDSDNFLTHKSGESRS